MEDESVKTYVCRISKKGAGIKGCGRKKEDDEIIWNILKTLTPPFKKVAMMIEHMIPCVDKFSKETLLGRLEVEKVTLKKGGDFPKI